MHPGLIGAEGSCCSEYKRTPATWVRRCRCSEQTIPALVLLDNLEGYLPIIHLPITSPDSGSQPCMSRTSQHEDWCRFLMGGATRAEQLPPCGRVLLPDGCETEEKEPQKGMRHCAQEPELDDARNFSILQPGSSVATALSEGESRRKHVMILEVMGEQWRTVKIALRTVRPFVFESVRLGLGLLCLSDAHRGMCLPCVSSLSVVHVAPCSGLLGALWTLLMSLRCTRQ